MKRSAAMVLVSRVAILLFAGMGDSASAGLGGNEVQINESSGIMKEPRLAVALDGGFVVVWNKDNSETVKEIWSRRYDASGNPIGNDFKISTGSGEHKKPNVAMADDGSFIVVWEKKNSETDRSIYARRYNASGVALGGMFLIITTPIGDLKEPGLASKSDGSFVVVWKKKVSETVEEIWSQRYDANGNPVGSEFLVNISSGIHKKPSIAVAADGSFVVVWEKKIAGNMSDILARCFDASGNPMSGELLLNGWSGDHGKAVMGMASDGSFVVAWKTKITDTDEDVFARRFDASGNSLGIEFQINTSGGKQSSPSLGVASDGSFTVVWEDKTGVDILGRDYDASGNPLGAEFTVNTTITGEQKKPNIGMNANGDAVAVWEDKTMTDIFATWVCRKLRIVRWDEVAAQ